MISVISSTIGSTIYTVLYSKVFGLCFDLLVILLLLLNNLDGRIKKTILRDDNFHVAKNVVNKI